MMPAVRSVSPPTREDCDARDHDAREDDDRTQLGPGLYVHIPFCTRKCFYCDFTAYHHRSARAEAYVADLLGEIRLRAQAEWPFPTAFRTVHFGGGTPSILSPTQFLRIVAALREAFPIDPAAEVALEANPEDLSEERLAAWAEAGVTRLSLGVQASQDHLLRALGRGHDWGAVVAGFRRIRAFGFRNVNVDLMFGLPGQELLDWQQTLIRVTHLEPDPPEHVSCYGLQVEPATTYARWLREGKLSLPGDELERRMYEMATAYLQDAGYEHYEISNFARPGYRSRHNLNYWAFGEYLGLGAGAASLWRRERFANHRYLRPYGDAVRAGVLPVAEWDERDRRTRMGEMIMLGTRLVEGLPIRWFVDEFGVRPETVFGQELQRLTERGLLRVTCERIVLTHEGRLLANEVWLELI